MIVVGLAGPAGSGKSAVARKVARRASVAWIDLDRVAWSTYEPDGPAFHALLARFGPDILAADGRVDRGALAAKAFGDPASKRDLERIVHPAVNAALAALIVEEGRRGRQVLLVEGALLASSPDVDRDLFGVILWLDVPFPVRGARLRKDGREHHAARNDELTPTGDFVRIDADASLDEVEERVWSAIEARRRVTPPR
ncbi:MAG: dephospho-CoA kinase [Candidatus Bipolaricaulota bacterium]|nr:dephospho-CoA kinase [Candidatus Bipolaricaulota bacterium]